MMGILGGSGGTTTGLTHLPRRYRQQCCLLCIFCMVGIWLSITSVRAADITWTNGSSTYETNSNWSPSTVPTLNDRAIFSDSAASSGYTVSFGQSESIADVLFSAVTKTVNWKVGSSNPTNTWTINNSVVFDEGASGTATGVLASGSMTVTNASGSGTFSVGNSGTGGLGLFKMELAAAGMPAPSLTVDHFNVTANSDFIFRAGTLTTQGASTINRGSQAIFAIGNVSGSSAGLATWNVMGGTNAVTYSSSSAATILGNQNGTYGALLVSGPNTLLTLGGGTNYVGFSGQGFLTVSNGAHVTSPTLIMARSSGTSTNNMVTVTGANSRLDISQGSAGASLGNTASSNQTYVLDGGVMALSGSGSLTLGNSSLSTANSITVSGTNSLFQTAGPMFVGYNAGNNAIIISNAASMAMVGSGGASLSIGVNNATLSANNTVKVSGGSLFMNSGSINVGNHGSNNSLTLDGGGTVTVNNGNLYISVNADAPNNYVTVSGGSSLAVSNSTRTGILEVGKLAAGSLTLNSGTVSVDRLMVRTASSTFTFNGGVLNITSDNANSQINNGSAFVVGNGTDAATLNLAAGAQFVVANGLQIAHNGTLTGKGTISGNTTSYGTVSPGHSADTLVFAGSLTLTPNSVLAMEIGGESPGQFDQIIVANGALTVDGTLGISLINGFTPANGDSFQLLDLSSCTSTSGVFAGFSLPSLGGGLSWDTSQLLVSGDLNVVPEPSSLALVIGGCCMLAWLGNRRRSRQ
jgi:T5SS/PEP-CTERM-associated repeat protein